MSQLSRRGFRALVFHLIYALEAHDYDISPTTVIDSFNRGFELQIGLQGEEAALVQALVENRAALDQQLAPVLANWKLERISTTTKLVLRMGLWELLHTDTPTNIVINEAVELDKNFDEPDAYRFVNGILDQLAKQVRPTN